MAARPFILFADENGWRIAAGGEIDPLDVNPGAAAESIASAIHARLHERGYDGAGVLLALPSAWCLAATIDTEDLPPNDRAALAFRLEEKLPIPSESFTADFAHQPGRALGVCVVNDRVRPLVDAIEAAGVAVQSIAPAAMLAVQALARLEGTHLVVWPSGRQVDVVLVENALSSAWSLIDDDPASLRLQINLLASWTNVAPPLIICSDSAGRALDVEGVEISRRPQSIEQAVTAIAPGVLSRRIVPWFEFRRGAMAARDALRGIRRSLNAAIGMAAVFSLVLAAIFLVRSVAYDHLARDCQQQLAQAFRRQFPGWPVPVNVKATAESELKRLTGGGDSAIPGAARESALRMLHDVLAGVPRSARLHLDRMTFNDTSMELGGTSSAHEDVEALAGAARAAGLEVQPPEMQKMPSAWRFSLRASKPAASSGGAP